MAEGDTAITAEAGTKTVTVAYEDKTASFAITVMPQGVTLSGISVTGPATTVYTVGEAFSAAGLAVTAAYSDASTSPVTGSTLSWTGGALTEGDTAITAETGTKTVTVAYQGKTASFAIIVNPATTPPASVIGQNKIDGQGQVVLSWTDPTDADLHHIEITWSPGGTTAVVIPKGTGIYTAAGLTNGTEYTFTIKAVDTSNNKSVGLSVMATPSAGGAADTTPPAKATGLAAQAGGGTSVTLTWTDPVDGDLDGIEITWEPGNGSATAAKSAAANRANSTSITGLSSGTAYTFTVKAKDTSGNLSAGATANATPLEPTAGVSVSFTGPADETVNLTGPGNPLSAAANPPITVTVTGSYQDYRWALDGRQIWEVNGSSGSSLTMKAGNLEAKRHTLTVYVTKGGVEYAKILTFTVTN